MFCRELNRGKCRTYLLACERTRHAVLIDPLKENTSRYIAVAVYHGFRLDYLIDSHTHADHRSGTFDLADLTDAKVVMEHHAPAPHVAVHVTHGDVLEVGDLRLKVLYTPGHTPDGISRQPQEQRNRRGLPDGSAQHYGCGNFDRARLREREQS